MDSLGLRRQDTEPEYLLQFSSLTGPYSLTLHFLINRSSPYLQDHDERKKKALILTGLVGRKVRVALLQLPEEKQIV